MGLQIRASEEVVNEKAITNEGKHGGFYIGMS